MSSERALTVAEQLTSIVYGDTFALYDDREFDAFLEPFRERLRLNEIPLDVFRGARCLDAGCGGGRGSMLMAQAGADEVVGIDLSDRNIETCRRRAQRIGLSQCVFTQGTLAELPFPDETFDIVWCNGVLHHAEDPDRGLVEITRVLRPGGRLWLYLYGSGGIYWYVMDWIRELLADNDVRGSIFQLRLMSVPVRRIAEWIDDWFTPFLRRYTLEDVQARLSELGFTETRLLRRGTIYDTSQRLVDADEVEAQLMGDGDLRFFALKETAPQGFERALPDPPGGKGSDYRDADVVTAFAEPLALVRSELEAVERRFENDGGLHRLAVCGSVHAKVRGLLERQERVDTDAFRDHLADLAWTLRELGAQA